MTLHDSPLARSSSGHWKPPFQGKATKHDMDKVISLFRFPKFYYEGFILRRTVLLSDGQPPKRTDPQPTWAKFYVQIAGTTMSSWDAVEMEIAAKQSRQVAPNYTNITDAHVYLPESDSAKSVKELKAPTQFIFFLNNAGRNKFVFSCTDHDNLLSWVTAIRLAAWERSRLSEIYTGTLLATRPEASQPKEKSEGWLMVRLPGDTEWTRVWCAIIDADINPSGSLNSKDPKRTKRASLFALSNFGSNRLSNSSSIPGTISEGDHHEPTLVFSSKKGAKKVLGTMSDIQAVAAMYPESKALIDSSTMFKIEGTFHTPGPPADRPGVEGFILATPGEGAVPDMVGWLLAIMDAFRLYGRPNDFNYDVEDPTSFYFGYPVVADADTLFLDRQTAEEMGVKESSLSRIRLALGSILARRLQASVSPLDSKSKPTPDPKSASSLKVTDNSPPAVEDVSAESRPVLTIDDLGDNKVSSPDSLLRETKPQPPKDASYTSSGPPTSVKCPPVSPTLKLPADTGIGNELDDFSSYFTRPESPEPSPVQPVSPASKSPISLPTPPTRNKTQSSPTLRPQQPEEIEDLLYSLDFSNESSPSEPSQSKLKPEFLSKPPPSSSSSSSKASPPVITMTGAPRTSFPSSFAASKKGAARIAAAQAAQKEKAEKAKAQLPGKGRSVGKGPSLSITKNKTWDGDSEDSEEEEDDDNDEEESDEDEDDDEDIPLSGPRSAKLPPQRSPDHGPHSAKNVMGQAHSSLPSFGGGHDQVYSTPEEPGSRHSHYPNLPALRDHPQSSQQGQFPSSSSRRDIPAVLRDQPDSIDTTGMQPAFSAHGLLQRVMQEKQERSAKAAQEAAHWSGEPLVQVNHKPPPPQNGLLGAIASHERDKKMNGGMGAALTERARERKYHEGRQREIEEMHRASFLAGGPPGGYGGFGGMMQGGMMPVMYPPAASMMGGMGGMSQMQYEQMMFYQAQQMQLQQQQAMLAAQQAYMSSFSGFPGHQQGGMLSGSPSMMGIAGGASPNIMAGGAGGGHYAHQSMYGGVGGGHSGPLNNQGFGFSPGHSPGVGGINNQFFGAQGVGGNVGSHNGSSGPNTPGGGSHQ